MLEKNKTYYVKNRSASVVLYTIPEMNNLRRQFMPGEIKSVTGDELAQLSYRPGGRRIIENYLLIKDKEVLKGLDMQVEPEYRLDEKGVIDLLKNGSDDQLRDCLDFAPEGVKDLIKTLAVQMPLNDLNKCQIIKEALGYDIVFIVNSNKQIAEEEGRTETVAAPKKRRVNAEGASEAVAEKPKKRRKVANPNYIEE